MQRGRALLASGLLTALACGFPPISALAADSPAPAVPAAMASYADIADLADSAPLVLRAQVRRLVPVEPARAPGVKIGWGRFYVEAKTRALIAGDAAMGESLRYLVDLPLDGRGKPPAAKGKEVLIFARAPNATRAGELQLVAPDAQLLWDVAVETKLRAILGELRTPGAPGRISGIREAIYVPGTLAGEGETQMFLAAPDDGAASITVAHQSGEPPRWGASFSEVLDAGARPPGRETLAWYRLACFLPPQLPSRANLSATREDQAQAEADYALVLRDLGDCPRTRR